MRPSLFAATAMSLFAASNIYEFAPASIEGKTHSLSDYKGKVVLIVNLASR